MKIILNTHNIEKHHYDLNGDIVGYGDEVFVYENFYDLKHWEKLPYAKNFKPKECRYGDHVFWRCPVKETRIIYEVRGDFETFCKAAEAVFDIVTLYKCELNKGYWVLEV